jgi:hypothetical protein
MRGRDGPDKDVSATHDRLSDRDVVLEPLFAAGEKASGLRNDYYPGLYISEATMGGV